MRPIPRDVRLDSTWTFRRDPFGFVSKGCERHESDVFETRILLRPTLCMRGAEAAALFYEPGRFERHGAPPGRIRKTLFGRGGVQGLDGEAHRHRKRMFVSLMTQERVGTLAEAFGEELRFAVSRWSEQGEVVLYRDVQEVLSRVACAWAGVPLDPSEVGRRTRQLTRLFDAAGDVGPRYWLARLARRRADAWGRRVIRDIRAGRRSVPRGSPTEIIATHRDPDGRLLEPHAAAVELLNLLRPIVAVSVYVTFVATALQRFPHCRRRVAGGDPAYAEWFVQEVRRFYPFFPAVVARVRHDFEWRGYRFRGGTRVLLDLHGTHQDPSAWKEPEAFQPERFRTWRENAFDFIPQGGGDVALNHRCPGEWITLALMRVALGFFVHEIRYRVPSQKLRVDRSRLPPLPHSGFVMADVRWRAREASA